MHDLMTPTPFLFKISVVGSEDVSAVAQTLAAELSSGVNVSGCSVLKPQAEEAPTLLSEITTISLKSVREQKYRFKNAIDPFELQDIFRFPLTAPPGIVLKSPMLLAPVDFQDGNIVLGKELRYWKPHDDIRVGSQTFIGPGLVIGLPGSGKTFFLQSVLSQVFDDSACKFIIIDSKKEHRVLKKKYKDALVIPVGTLKIPWNPLAIPKGVNPAYWCGRLGYVIKIPGRQDLYHPILAQNAVVQAIESLYAEKGWKSNVSTFLKTGKQYIEGEQPTPGELMDKVNEVIDHNTEARYVQGVKAMLTPLRLFFKKHTEMNCAQGLDIDKIFQKYRGIVFEIDVSDPFAREMFIRLIFNQVMCWLSTQPQFYGETMKPRIQVVVEEAHNVIGQTTHPLILQDMLKRLREDRTRGIGYWFVNQTITDLHPDLRKISRFSFVGGVIEEKEKEIATSILNLSDQYKRFVWMIFGSLRPGEILGKVWNYDKPFLIKGYSPVRYIGDLKPPQDEEVIKDDFQKEYKEITGNEYLDDLKSTITEEEQILNEYEEFASQETAETSANTDFITSLEAYNEPKIDIDTTQTPATPEHAPDAIDEKDAKFILENRELVDKVVQMWADLTFVPLSELFPDARRKAGRLLDECGLFESENLPKSWKMGKIYKPTQRLVDLGYDIKGDLNESGLHRFLVSKLLAWAKSISSAGKLDVRTYYQYKDDISLDVVVLKEGKIVYVLEAESGKKNDFSDLSKKLIPGAQVLFLVPNAAAKKEIDEALNNVDTTQALPIVITFDDFQKKKLELKI